MDFTRLARTVFTEKVKEARSWKGQEAVLQSRLLTRLLTRAKDTKFGRENRFSGILASSKSGSAGANYALTVPLRGYEAFRDDIMRMIHGEKDILWPGLCRNFAQSSGTTGGRSKYLPVTEDGLKENHYKGASYSVAFYLASNPSSRLFSGKGLILGGSFANEVVEMQKGVEVGDLSATLIERVNPLVNMFRIPDKKTALLADWQTKLPLIAEKASRCNVTNISGVPSWMMRVLLKVLEIKNAALIKDVWPNLEVFFHGGISFAPYREEYRRLCAGLDMHFSEVYNASEGYFACSDRPASMEGSEDGNEAFTHMLLLPDVGVYYEFLPLGADIPVGIADIKPGKIYELIVTTVNGLWRYRLGDTIKVEGIDPVRISVAGRTKSFINAFGEELMENNAETALAEACRLTGASIHDYTVAPVYAHGRDKGRHQWLIEWKKAPASVGEFVSLLDANLRKVNSDYDAKRSHDIFLDIPEVVSVPRGTFHRWLSTSGSGKLGGQRKVPRLSNDRSIADAILHAL